MGLMSFKKHWNITKFAITLLISPERFYRWPRFWRRHLPLFFVYVLSHIAKYHPYGYGLGLFMYLLYLTLLVQQAEDARWGKLIHCYSFTFLHFLMEG